METRTEKRTKMQTPTLVALVVGLHVMAVGSIVFIQGCGTTRTASVEPPPAPVMPPDPEVTEGRRIDPQPDPVFQPSVATRTETREAAAAEPKTYTVRPGDNLSTIAKNHGVRMADIVDLNQLADPDDIKVDQTLLLPPGAAMSGQAQGRSASTTTRRPAPTVEGAEYVIQSGDSLSAIAVRHGVTTARLAEANNITNPDRIKVGQSLIIPGASEARSPESTAPSRDPEPAAEPDAATEPNRTEVTPAPAAAEFAVDSEPFPHTVQAGDTLDQLARDFSVLKEDILRLNNLTGDENLRPGQTIMIPAL